MDLALDPGTDLQRYLRHVSERWWGAQVFLFDATGNKFWAARHKIRAAEIAQLRAALDYIEECEEQQPKPFLSHSVELSVTVAALGGWSDLYLVVLAGEPDRARAEARLALDRDELGTWLSEDPQRIEVLRTTQSGIGLSAD